MCFTYWGHIEPTSRSMVNWLRRTDGNQVATLLVQFGRRSGELMELALMARCGIDAGKASVKLRDLARQSGHPLAEAPCSLLRRPDLDPA